MSRKKKWNGPHHGGWSTTSISGIYVSVFCKGDDAAPHDKWRIGSFHPDFEFSGDARWVADASGYADHERDTYFVTHPPLTQWLVGDEWVHRTETRQHRDDPSFRMRWSLRCPTCQYGQVFRDTAQYTTAISSLASLRSADGILEISLRAFTGFLRAS